MAIRYFRRAAAVLRGEGLSSLTEKTLDFIKERFYKRESLYLYEHTMRPLSESDYLPYIHELDFFLIKTRKEMDDLVIKGYDIRYSAADVHQRLAAGAIAFAFFSGGELAHIGWLAFSEKAKQTIDPYPYKVDFAARESCTGGSVTIPKFERKGLMGYGYYKRLQYLYEKGFKKTRASVLVDNLASNRTHLKFGAKRYAKAEYFKIMWWHSWKKFPIELTSN